MSSFFNNVLQFGSASKRSTPSINPPQEPGELQPQHPPDDENSVTSDVDTSDMPTTQQEDVLMESQEHDEDEEVAAETTESQQPFATQPPEDEPHDDGDEAPARSSSPPTREDKEAMVEAAKALRYEAHREESPRQSPGQEMGADDEEEETDEPVMSQQDDGPETQMPEDAAAANEEEEEEKQPLLSQDPKADDEDENPSGPETQIPEEVQVPEAGKGQPIQDNGSPNVDTIAPMQMQTHHGVNQTSGPVATQRGAILTTNETTMSTREHRTVTLPPVMPARAEKNNFQRYRSLSKVFTSLPEKLPDVGDMMCDMVEYLCQIMLMENSLEVERLSMLQIRLEQLLPHAADYLNTAGRINSRLQLVALKLDLAHSAAWDTNDWDTAIQQLRYVRVRLLLITANDPPKSNSSGNSHATGSDTTRNEQLMQHPSMTVEYKEAMNGLKWQRALAKFRESLTAATTNRTTSVHTIEAAIDEYRRSLQLIFGAPVPPHLVGFVKADVYSPKRQKHYQGQPPQHATAERLLSHIAQRHDGNVASSVLLRWAEVILDPPSLIQLSYGGVSGISGNLPNHLLQHDDDDVSSIGQGDQIHHEQQCRQSPDRTTPVANFKLSAEEQEAVDQLAKVARPAADVTMQEEEVETTASSDDSKTLPTATIATKKRTVDSVWSVSSDDDDAELLAKGGGGRKKSIFRLWSALQKRRMKEQQQRQPPLLINDSSSFKENSDPRTGSGSEHDGDAEDEDEEVDDTSVMVDDRQSQKASHSDPAEHNDDDGNVRGRSAGPVDSSWVDDDDSDHLEAASLRRKSRKSTVDKDEPEEAEEDEEKEEEEYQDQDSSSSEEDASFIHRPARVAKASQRGAAADVVVAARDRSAPRQRDLLSDDELPAAPRRRGRKMFTPEEDEAILTGIEKHGFQWSMIQKSDPRLKNRNQTDIRCRYRNIKDRLPET